MIKNKATTTLAVIVVIASLMVGATVAIVLMSEGIGLQQANAVPKPKPLRFCNEHSPSAGTTTPPCNAFT